jgi:hypothetical protein
MMMHEFTGYFVVDSHGHTRRATVTYSRDDQGQWFDLDGVDPQTGKSEPAHVVFQQGDVAAEYGKGIDDGVAIAAIYDNDQPFVLDTEGVEWLKKNDPHAITWLWQVSDPFEDDPAGWVHRMGGPGVSAMQIAFLDAWYGWTSGEPDVREIEAAITKTVTAMVVLAQCENAIGDVTISFAETEVPK